MKRRPSRVAVVLATCALLAAGCTARALVDSSFRARVVAPVEMLRQTVDEAAHPIELFDEPVTASAVVHASHGVASGDVTSTTAIIWARATGPSQMYVEYGTAASFAPEGTVGPLDVSPATDHTAAARLTGLSPDTRYRYCVRFAAGPSGCGIDAPGTFRTAPDHSTAAPLSFVFSGDLGGAGYCRSVDGGYAIFDAMRALAPDFFVAAGDMIYVDDPCPSDRPGGGKNVPGGFLPISSRRVDWSHPADVREVYLRHWRYNRADPAFQRFLASTPMYAQWDDHETLNDAGSSWSEGSGAHVFRSGYRNLVQAAQETFFAYSPIDREQLDPGRIYRSFHWGASVDLFLLDARSHRSRNDMPDGSDKTMLGREQLEWLERGLSESRATWKIVSGEVPLSIPTGGIGAVAFGRDGWARGDDSRLAAQTGFQRELLELIRSLDDHDVRNVVFITADLHRPVSIQYRTDPNGDGRPILFHELVAGPLSAGTRTTSAPGPDRVLGPTVLYEGRDVFNFGYVRVVEQPDRKSHLLADVRGADGAVRPGSSVDLSPE